MVVVGEAKGVLAVLRAVGTVDSRLVPPEAAQIVGSLSAAQLCLPVRPVRVRGVVQAVVQAAEARRLSTPGTPVSVAPTRLVSSTLLAASSRAVVGPDVPGEQPAVAPARSGSE